MQQETTLIQEDNRTPDRRTGLSVLSGRPLTLREQEVWLLMAGGWSDAEIADRLALNCLTVRVHLCNVLAKLGAASRQQAAALARHSCSASNNGPEHAPRHG
jgi:DNA-binding NarL/FixJ family response regulator